MENKIFMYNWKELSIEGKGKCKDIINLVKILTGHKKNFSREQYIKAVKLSKVEKPSFALNINKLLEHKKSTAQDKCLALFLGAKRNYATYLIDKDSSLPIMIVEDILDINKLKTNPLLYIEGDFIKFEIN